MIYELGGKKQFSSGCCLVAVELVMVKRLHSPSICMHSVVWLEFLLEIRGWITLTAICANGKGEQPSTFPSLSYFLGRRGIIYPSHID